MPNLVELFRVEWHVLSLGRHTLFVAVNHGTQSISPRPISGKLSIVRDRRCVVFMIGSLPRSRPTLIAAHANGGYRNGTDHRRRDHCYLIYDKTKELTISRKDWMQAVWLRHGAPA